VATQGTHRGLLFALLTLGVALLACAPSAAQDIVRFNQDIPGDSKPILLLADDMATWVEGGLRVILLKGNVLVEHGVVQARMEQAVAWIDQDHYRQTGVLEVHLYGEGNVALENGPETHSGPRALIDLRTRGEVKLRAYNGKIVQQAQPNDPLYRRAREMHAPQRQAAPPGTIQRTSLMFAPDPEPTAPTQATPTQGPGNAPVWAPAQPSGPVPAPAGPVAPADQLPEAIPPITVPTPAPGPPPSNLTPGPPPALPAAPAVPGAAPTPAPAAPPPAPAPPARDIRILPRTGADFNTRSVTLPNGENVIVVTGGIIVIVRNLDNTGLVDIEADRLVFWTRGNPQEVLTNLRSQHGQTSKELEFYMTGTVEIRQQNGPEIRTLRADEVYYDVGRSIAVAMRADVEFRNPKLPDPIHMRAEELDQLSDTLFKGIRSEVFSSRLPSDPGLKVYVAEGTLEELQVPKRSIFGVQVIDRTTGQPIVEQQRLFTGRNTFVELENVPIFWTPYIQGDANDPLGPLRSVNFGYNKIFGARLGANFNAYDLFGLQPLAGTRWILQADYLSQRGPALGTEFDHASPDFFGLPARVTGSVRAYYINDDGTDQLGGGRGPNDNHPINRGRLRWDENIQDLPEGFSIQGQLAVLSDKNFLEQYFPSEWSTDFNQETFLYVKQQQQNWAWTIIANPYLRNWVTETERLPEARGYLIGQSIFDIFTYSVRASAGYDRLRVTDVPPPPVEITQQDVNTVRLDLGQELALPFTLGPFRLVPYANLDLTYYSEALDGSERGRAYEGGGVRSSIPFTRIYPDVQSDLLNLNGINHKIVLSGNYYYAHSDTPYTKLPQLDPVNDDATDQALRDIKPLEPALNPGHGIALALSPLFDPQLYAIHQLVDSRIDTLDDVQAYVLDLNQRWQTKRGYPGQEHITDWMILDLKGAYFPDSGHDTIGRDFSYIQYDWLWNIGDRTALMSSGWTEPTDHQGVRVFTIGASLNRPDRTSFFLGYREIDPLNSQAVTGAVTYIFSPKYAVTASATYDFGVNIQSNSLIFTRMGSDLQVSIGITYNSTLNTVGALFEIMPNIAAHTQRGPGIVGLGGPGGLH
jgi:hypothetical protein